MRIRDSIGRLFAVAVLAGAVSFSGPGYAQDPVQERLETQRVLSILSAENSNPALAYSPDGTRLFVAWDGLVGGHRRILLRERVAGEWLPAVIVDTNPSGQNSLPSVSVDAAGVPHVAWISTVGEKRQPVYAYRLSRFPNTWFRQAVPFPAESELTGNCDYVNLQIDSNDRPWIAWQYGYGNVLGIACSHYGDDGEFVSDEITPGATSLNLYPELYFTPQPTVNWYFAQSNHFYLLGSQYDEQSRQWSLAVPEHLENLPADSLPDLFRTSRGPLAAIWYETLNQEDGNASDRIFLGVQDEETKGRGEVIDRRPQASNHSVAGTAPHGVYITSWVSETYEDGASIYLGVGDSPDSLITVKVSANDGTTNSNPKVAGSRAEAAVAWEEKAGVASPSSEIVVRIADIRP